MMKQTAFLSALFLHSCSVIQAQDESKPNLVLYASFGLRQVPFQSQFYTNSENPKISTALGAGSYWSNKRFLIGTEFFYSNGLKQTTSYKAQYSGFNSNLYVGYKVMNENGWGISPLCGVGAISNQIFFADKTNASSEIQGSNVFSNSSVAVHTALSIEKVFENGTFFGLKFGYDIPIAGKENWFLEGPDTKTIFADNPSGLFIQFTTGGLIEL